LAADQIIYKRYESALNRLFPAVSRADLKSFSFEAFYNLVPPRKALLYSGLFCPDLETCCGYYVLRHVKENSKLRAEFEALVKSYQDEAISTQEFTQRMHYFNFLETCEVFEDFGLEFGDEENECLTHLIRYAWDAWLLYTAPEREFEVEVSKIDLESGIGVVSFAEKVGNEVT
jgi:hypothetical protein